MQIPNVTPGQDIDASWGNAVADAINGAVLLGGMIFAKYKLSPQYQQVNAWMTLADFQRIFFWEYLHRLLGRLIGVAVIVPWLAFN